MLYEKCVYLCLVILLLCVWCGLKEGVVQKEPKSYLWFTGNTKNATVYIDDLSPIILNENTGTTSVDRENNIETSDKIHYKISPGKHRIIVKKMGEEVVNRIVFLGNGIIKEIEIPWENYILVSF